MASLSQLYLVSFTREAIASTNTSFFFEDRIRTKIDVVYFAA